VDELYEGPLNPNKEDESGLLPNGSAPSSGSVPLGTDFEATLLRRSQRENIPYCRFEIEGEAFMFSLQEADEPKNYQEVMTSPTFEEWNFLFKKR